MGIKSLKMVLLITAIPLSFAATCHKDSTIPCSGYTPYSFKITSEWSTQQGVYHIGDTLILTSTFLKNLTDYSTPNNQQINYANSTGIGGAGKFYELDSVQHQVIGATNKFDFISQIGNVGNNVVTLSDSKSFLLQEQSSTYDLKIKIVPKAKGIFAFFVPDFTSAGLIGKDCTNAAFIMTVTNSDKHIPLFQFAMQRPPASQYEFDRIYCFRIQ